MDRTKFYTQVTVTNPEGDTNELDFLWNSLSDFEMQYTPGYYRIVGSDDMNAYYISYKLYGTIDFWWVILLVNQIEDPFTGIEIGAVLTVPNVLDIYNFQKKYRVRS